MSLSSDVNKALEKIRSLAADADVAVAVECVTQEVRNLKDKNAVNEEELRICRHQLAEIAAESVIRFLWKRAKNWLANNLRKGPLPG